MIFTADNLVYALAEREADYSAFRDRHGAQGFRTISLALAGDAGHVRYTGVMAKYPTPFRGQSNLSMDEAGVLGEVARQAGDNGLHPYILSATGAVGQAVFAAAFRVMDAAPVVQTNMTAGEFADENARQHVQNASDPGRILLWVDSYGTAADIRYCAIWGANPNRVAWNAEGVDEVEPEHLQRLAAMRSIEARPSRLAMTPAGTLATAYVDSRINGSWELVAFKTPGGFAKIVGDQAAARRFPVCIGWNRQGGTDKYSAIFAESDTLLARSFRTRGPAVPGLGRSDRAKVADIDDWMEDYVRAHGFRGAAMAIVEDTRLVHAKGYTFAEPASHYSDIQPTTLFRMASVSKTFCAIAIWRALNQQDLPLDTLIQSILDLKRPNGTPPTDADFADITFRHLLESNSGIEQLGIRSSIAAVRDHGGAQPLGLREAAAMVAALAMPGEPGGLLSSGEHDTHYGRTDYCLLALAATRLAGAANFNAALKALVLDPLQMTRTRTSRSRAELRADDEAPHHVAPGLETGTSVVHEDRRLVPFQYGAENYETYSGAGGVSTAMVDLARLCAMLSCRAGNPLFDPPTLDALIQAAIAATSAGNDHGYHGFDWAIRTGGEIELEKGGGLSGVGSGLKGRIGGYFIVLARNGVKVEGAVEDWKTPLLTKAAAVDWGGADLFPSFGMASLGV